MKKGFTLAEVLITLGIIGVVAAMTIPNLIANANANKYRSQFKKTVSSLSQAARMSENLYGYDFAGISSACGVNGGTDNPEVRQSICAMLNGTLKGITYVDKISDLRMPKSGILGSYGGTSPYMVRLLGSADFSNSHAYVLADGSIFAFYRHLGQTNGCALPTGNVMKDVVSSGTVSNCFGFIDVNGVNLPNTEVSCSSGSYSLSDNTCVVKNDAKHMTDIYPVRVHDGIVEPATAAARYVLKSAK